MSDKQHEVLAPDTRPSASARVWGKTTKDLMDLGVGQVLLIPIPPGRVAKTFRESVARMVRRKVQGQGGRWFKTTLSGPNVRVTRKK